MFRRRLQSGEDPRDLYNVGDTVKVFVGKYQGRVGVIKSIGKTRLTLEFPDGSRGFCDAKNAKAIVEPTSSVVTPAAVVRPDTNTDTDTDVESINQMLNDLALQAAALMKLNRNVDADKRKFFDKIDRLLDQP